MRRAHKVDASRIDDDDLCTLANRLLHLRGEDGVPVGRVGANQQDYVGLFNAVEGLRTRGGAECLLQAVTGRRVADARAGIDIVIVEAGADELLYDVDFLDRATR